MDTSQAFDQALGSYHAGNYKEAIPLLESLVAQDDSFAAAWYNLSCCYCQVSELDRAKYSLLNAMWYDSECQKEALSDPDLKPLHEWLQELSANVFTRPPAVWFLGIAGFVVVGAVTVGLVLATLTDPDYPQSVLIILMFCLACAGFVSIGVVFGSKIALILGRIIWTLWLLLVCFSIWAASRFGGPNWGHGVGLLISGLTALIWSRSVSTWCWK